MSFEVLDGDSLGGTFDTVTLPPLAPGLAWNISQLYVTGVISVGLPGDFNNDANVDAADYVVFRISISDRLRTTPGAPISALLPLAA